MILQESLQKVKILFALLISFSFYIFFDFEKEILVTLSIAIFIATLWITEAFPLYITALIVPFLISVFNILDIKEALKPFSSSVVFLVLGGLALSVIAEYHGVHKWIAFNILKLAKNSLIRLYVLLISTTFFLSMFISNTATTALMLPIIIGMAAKYNNLNLIKMLLLAVAYSANIGGIATLIGTAPNAIAAEILKIDFLEWFKYNFILAVVMVMIASLIIWKIFNIKEKTIDFEIKKVSLSKQGFLSLIVIIITILLWFLSPLIGIKFLNTTSISILAIILIFLFNLIPYKEFEKRINWGILLLLGGGMSLGYALDKSGSATFLAKNISNLILDYPLYFIILIFVAVGVFLTEIMSNTAVTAKFVPILLGIALNINVLPEMLIMPFAVATSMAFMLPIATPPNALVFSTKYIDQIDMIKVGIILNIIAIFVITNWYYFIMKG